MYNNIKYRNYEYNNNMVNTWITKGISVDSKINKWEKEREAKELQKKIAKKYKLCQEK